MTNHKIDISVSAALTSLLFGAAYYCGEVLKNTVSQNEYSLTIISLSLLAGILSALSLLSLISLLSIAISSIWNLDTGLWPTLSFVTLRFSVYVIINWLLIWGIPFTISIVLYSMVRNIIGELLSYILAIIAIIPSFMLVFKIFPRREIGQFSNISLSENIGKPLAITFIVSCFLTGHSFIQNCYVFDVTIPERIYKKDDILEVKANLKGRIFNHDKLVARIYNHKSNKIIDILKFEKYDTGNYITWENLSNFENGIYRLDVLFSNYTQSSLLGKFKLFIFNNHRHKTHLFLINERKDHISDIPI